MDIEDNNTNLPLLTRKETIIIHGITTDIIITEFIQHLFIIVSQIGTFGSILEVLPGSKTFSDELNCDIKVRLGRHDDPLLLVYARQFMEQFGIQKGKKIVTALGLRDRSSEAFQIIINTLHKIIN